MRYYSFLPEHLRSLTEPRSEPQASVAPLASLGLGANAKGHPPVRVAIIYGSKNGSKLALS
jgi:hypothetical protein